MRRHRLPMLLFGVISCALALGAGSWNAVPAEKGTRVTLHRRGDNEAYGRSAYSFRHISQDIDEHRNEVDVVFNNCGNLHISAGGGTNRVARVSAKSLAKLVKLPTGGWSTGCFSPEKSALYVMEIKDARQTFFVKLRVTDAKQDKLVFEWLPLRPRPENESGTVGTLGTCGGQHDCN